jgi:hypothetical protein
MKTGLAAVAVAVACALPTAAVFAHHSGAMYDLQHPITVTGIVARIELKNPHSLFYLTVTDKDGKQVEWALECQPLSTLTAYGWTAATMKVGDRVTAAGSPARNGTPAMMVSAIQLPDGRTIRT